MSWLDDLIAAFAPVEKTPAHVSTDGTVEGDVTAEETFNTKVDEALMEPMTLALTQEDENEFVGHLAGVGKGRDVTRHDYHEPEKRLGTPSDFAAEFYASQRSVETGGESLYPEDAHPDAFKHLEGMVHGGTRDKSGERGSYENPVMTENEAANSFITTVYNLVAGAPATRIAIANDRRIRVLITASAQAASTVFIGKGAAAANGGGFPIANFGAAGFASSPLELQFSGEIYAYATNNNATIYILEESRQLP